VRRGIINVELFDPLRGGAANGPDVLMIGFLAALASSTFWLVMATYFGLPVSTTHSIVGSLVGVGMTFGGGSAVTWLNSEKTGLDRLKNSMVGVVASWVLSPVISAVFAVFIFLVVRTAVLRRANPYRNGLMFLPFFYSVTVAMTVFFIIYKGSPNLHLDEKFTIGQAAIIAVGGGGVVALLSWWFIIPQAKGFVDRWEREQHSAAAAKVAPSAAAPSDDDEDLKSAIATLSMDGDDAGEGGAKKRLGKLGFHMSIEDERNKLEDDASLQAMHDNVEKFDPKAEHLFSWLQIFTAAFDSFAHGANDVANSIGPFSSIYQLYRSGGRLSTFDSDKFEEGGVFSGGRRDGIPYAKGSSLVDGQSFCGSIGAGVRFYRCRPEDEVAFPASSTVPAGATPVVFDLYDSAGNLTTTDVTCHSSCSVSNYAAYNSQKQEVPLWILAMGGAGIVVGLAMWGYRIIVAIGMKLTKLTPSRGFSIEVGAAVTVILASRVGVPVSTTHCQVGSTLGVGMVELKGNTVNWKQFFGIAVGWYVSVRESGLVAGCAWVYVAALLLLLSVAAPVTDLSILVFAPTLSLGVLLYCASCVFLCFFALALRRVFTVIVTGVVAAGIFAFAIFTPSLIHVPQDVTRCPGGQLFAYDEATGLFNGIQCSGVVV